MSRPAATDAAARPSETSTSSSSPTSRQANARKPSASSPEVDRVLVKGDAKCSVVTRDGLQCDLRVVPEAHYGAALMYFTGSTEHNKRLRNLAIDRGHTLNDWGVFEK